MRPADGIMFRRSRFSSEFDSRECPDIGAKALRVFVMRLKGVRGLSRHAVIEVRRLVDRVRDYGPTPFLWSGILVPPLPLVHHERGSCICTAETTALVETCVLYVAGRNRGFWNPITDMFKSAPFSVVLYGTPPVFDKVPLSRSYYWCCYIPASNGDGGLEPRPEHVAI